MTTEARLLLGTALDGDLHSMCIPGPRGRLGRRQHFGLTWDDLTHHIVLIGGTGSGKTVTLLRIAAGIQALRVTNPDEPPPAVIYLDAKGLPDENRAAFLSAAAATGADAIVAWPEQSISGFSGTTYDIRERISGLWDAEESSFHHSEAVTLLQLAVNAEPTPRSLGELVARTQAGATAAAYAYIGTPEALAKQDQASKFSNTQWNSLNLRLAALMATVGTSLDSGPTSTELANCDAAWVSIPGTRSPQAAADIATWFLGLVSDLATRTSPRRTLVILDEFSAIGGSQRASAAAAGLVERTRSAGIGMIVSSQTTEALGQSRGRLMQTVGTVIAHRTPKPDDIVTLAGTSPIWEDTHEVGNFGIRKPSSGREQQQHRVPPNLVRALPTGEAVVIHHGRWANVFVAAADKSGLMWPTAMGYRGRPHS